MSEIRFPDITVKLSERDGNAVLILGAVKKAMKKNGVPKEVQDEFMNEAKAGDYDQLLATVFRWVMVD